jgi:hypothetical protein
MKITILPDGDLELSLEPADDREGIRADADKRGDDAVLWDLTEPYWTNGGFQPFDAGDANPFVGLSSAPCIAESMDTHDDGENEIVGRFWYFARYMLDSIIDELLEHGRVVFQKT